MNRSSACFSLVARFKGRKSQAAWQCQRGEGVAAHRAPSLLGWQILEGQALLARDALVQTFADQAVIAIENVRLFDEVQARTRELAASLDDLRKAQDRLIQSEKLASLGQLTAGIAHEISGPGGFSGAHCVGLPLRGGTIVVLSLRRT